MLKSAKYYIPWSSAGVQEVEVQAPTECKKAEEEQRHLMSVEEQPDVGIALPTQVT